MQFVARILGLVASIGTVALTTRYLGPDDYGLLTTAVMFIGLWTSLTELGIGAVIVRRVTSGVGDLGHLVRVNFGLSITYCVPLGALTMLAGWLIYRDDSSEVAMVAIVGGGLILTTLGSCFTPVFMTDVRFAAVAASDLAGRLVSFGATALLVHLHADVYWFALVQLIPPATILLIQGLVAHRVVGARPAFSRRDSWLLVRESLPQTGVLIVAALYWRSDGVLLSVLSTREQTGGYGLAYGIAFNITAISTVFLTSTLSTMTNLYASDRSRFAAFTERSMQAMLFVGAPLAVVGVLAAPGLVRLIGSEEFVEAGGLTLGLLFVAVALRLVTGTLSQALFAAHDQVFLLRLNVVGLVLNIATNVVVIPPFGAKGAAGALVASELFGLVVAAWRLRTRTGYRSPWAYTVHLLVPAAAAAGTFLVLDGQHVLVAGAAAATVYVAANLTVGPVRLRDAKGLARGEAAAEAAATARGGGR
ncbi:flippase [Tsukamurella sp. 1534]|uniref:flippase n=1 Tax=Tsukamurella sp. 1534 TaxID=1151061 RepID=UPI0002D3FC54|nr:flippase [Tsukamurella sp. 1534]